MDEVGLGHWVSERSGIKQSLHPSGSGGIERMKEGAAPLSGHSSSRADMTAPVKDAQEVAFLLRGLARPSVWEGCRGGRVEDRPGRSTARGLPLQEGCPVNGPLHLFSLASY